MALFRRDEPTNIIPPPGGQTEIRQVNRPSWVILLGAAVAILLISTGLVFGGRWVYRSIKNEPAKQPVSQPTPSTTTPSPQPPAGTTKPPAPQPSPPSGTPSPTPTPLPQNGPGEVAALFIGASLAAAGLHYLISLRRQTG